MPNWVDTQIEMSGEKEEIEKCLKMIINKEEQFDFNSISQMPQVLIDVTSPVVITGDSKWEALSDSDKARNIKESYSQELIEKYGANNWYDWATSNWGTKWNACETILNDDNFFSFQTAWSFPEPLIKKLSSLFPTISFHCEFADEDIGSNCGIISFQAGECTLYEDKSGDTLWALNIKYGEDAAQEIYAEDYADED